MLAASNKKVLGVIPARLHSTRFPKKILSDFGGKPMVIRTAESASKSRYIDKVIIAVDDLETVESLRQYPFELIMTSNNHQSGTDRVSEVASKFKDMDIILNIQADEPFIDPDSIDNLIKSFEDHEVEISTLVNPNLSDLDLDNLNVVKSVVNSDNNGIDFLRKIDKKIEKTIFCKHIGIYGFVRKALHKFVSLDRSLREKERSLEQMRALDNGMKIKVVFTDLQNLSIDTENDYLEAMSKGIFQ